MMEQPCKAKWCVTCGDFAYRSQCPQAGHEIADVIVVPEERYNELVETDKSLKSIRNRMMMGWGNE